MPATDAVAARVIGLDPNNIEYMSLAEEAGVGTLDPDQIKIMGKPLAGLRLDLKTSPTSSDAFAALFPEVRFINGEPCSGCVGSVYLSLTRARLKAEHYLPGCPFAPMEFTAILEERFCDK